MQHHVGLLSYFFQASFIVKCVMFILLAASLVCWTFIFQRLWYFNKVKKQYHQFNKRFWDSLDLSQLYTDLDAKSQNKQGLAAIFHKGFKEFLHVSKIGEVTLEPIQRVMQITQAKEAQQLEKHLPIFASIGSIAPYIGLFGTVWGIMVALQALGQAQQATIAMVAPGISEALFATALGLFTAIPAVIAYNRYTTQANQLLNQYEIFQDELIALIVRQTGYMTKQ